MKIINSMEELLDHLGIKPGDQVVLQTPQFEREYDIEINFVPQDKEELKALIESAPREVLVKMGIRPWAGWLEGKNDPDSAYLKKGQVHYLYPGEWFESLPEGIEVMGIWGSTEKFYRSTSDDDIRFGCLPYGFVRYEDLKGNPMQTVSK